MIKSFVKIQDPPLPLDDPNSYESFENVIKKLDYFRKLSRDGIHLLASDQGRKLQEEFVDFFSALVPLHLNLRNKPPFSELQLADELQVIIISFYINIHF